MQLRPKIIAGLLAFALPFAAWAQKTLHLEFESDSIHRVSVGTTPEALSFDEFQGRTASLSIDHVDPHSAVFVVDETSGNMASRPLSAIKGDWKLTPGDYNHIGTVELRLESKGQPVAAAIVDVGGTTKTRSNFISPGEKGTTHFMNVPPGTFSLTVRFKVNGKDADPIKQSFDLSLKREKPVPTLVISIPDAVDVVASTPSSSSSPSPQTSVTPKPQPSGEGSILGRIVTILIVLALVGGVAYYVLVVMRKNGDTVQDKLRQLGVDIPKPAGDPADPNPSPVTPIAAPAPPEKIILSAATPDPIVQSPAQSGTPQLRMANGDVFELPEGETIVGRELGLSLSLVNESTVSRRHASLVKAGSDVRLKDLGSSNGTFVNGQRVSGEVPLNPGDSVQFGAVQCRFEG